MQLMLPRTANIQSGTGVPDQMHQGVHSSWAKEGLASASGVHMQAAGEATRQGGRQSSSIMPALKICSSRQQFQDSKGLQTTQRSGNPTKNLAKHTLIFYRMP